MEEGKSQGPRVPRTHGPKISLYRGVKAEYDDNITEGGGGLKNI